MKQTIRKVVRYFALGALILGLLLITYGSIVNQVAMTTFFALLNQGGFKAFIIGILLVVAAVTLLIMSFFVGRGREDRPAPRNTETPES